MTVVSVPGSKSVTARALFLAAAADGVSTLTRPLRSDDTEAFVEGLRAMGHPIEQTADQWRVDGATAGAPADGTADGTAAEADVFCRDAATASRFLPALAATRHGKFRFDASPQMRRRPVGPLTDALRELGAELRHEGQEGHLPLTIHANGLRGGDLSLDASLSSQFLTALLMAAPLMEDGLRITVTDLVSAPYVEITVAMMRAFGVEVMRDGDTLVVPPGGYLTTTYQVEPDASTASYFFAAAALTGREVTVPGLGASALQGDVRFVELLEQMGATVRVDADSITVRGPEQLRGITANMRDISDTMPTLAAIAPWADGPVRIEDVYNTRVKECDRLDACAENLRRMGVRVTTGPDWIQIWPGVLDTPEIGCRGDHRIAMSFSVAGLMLPGLTLDDPGCVKKTFPEFHEALSALRQDWNL
ncbi:MAG: 3-phosphoshikimate 1-carboxyvinyltransferase [Micromonosporaceae bacterium]